MGCFDLEILLKSPLALATKCFSKLFMSFRFRGYFVATEETQAQEEYLSYVDELRVKFPEFDQPTLLIPDTITFIMGQTSIQTRPLLLRCFKLACLCLDEPFRSLPTVKFGSVNTDNYASKLIDVILPVQSYFSSVPGSVEAVTSESSISEFLELESTFGRGPSAILMTLGWEWISSGELIFYQNLILMIDSALEAARRNLQVLPKFSRPLSPFAIQLKLHVPLSYYPMLKLISLQRVYVRVVVKTNCI